MLPDAQERKELSDDVFSLDKALTHVCHIRNRQIPTGLHNTL